MSSGVAVLPVGAMLVFAAAPVMVAALVVVAALTVAGAAVVLITRAAMAGAEAMAGGLVRIGELVDAKRDQYIEAEVAAQAWQLAAAEVVRRNSEIASLLALAKKVRGEPAAPIPSPFELAGKNLCEIRDWCQRADDQIAIARQELHRRVADESARQLTALLPRADVRLLAAADALAEGRGALAAAHAAASRQAKARSEADEKLAAADLRRRAERVEAALARLDPAALPADRAKALEIGVKAVSTDHEDTGRTHVDHLLLVVVRANKRADDARAANWLLQGLQVSPTPDGLTGAALAEVSAVATRLEAVVAGEHELDQELTEQAQCQLRVIEAAAYRQFEHEQLRSVMIEAGWSVESDFTTLSPGVTAMTLGARGWDHYHLRVVRDADSVRYLSQRDYSDKRKAQQGLDKEFCAESAALMRHVADKLSARGVKLPPIEAIDDPPVRFLGETPAHLRHQDQDEDSLPATQQLYLEGNES